MDGRVLGFALLVSVGAGALFGLLPALHVARGDLQDSLRGRTETQGVSRIRLRGLLVVSEVALAVMLVIGAGLLLRSFANVLEVEPGFDPRLCWLRSRFSLLASRFSLLASRFSLLASRFSLVTCRRDAPRESTRSWPCDWSRSYSAISSAVASSFDTETMPSLVAQTCPF